MSDQTAQTPEQQAAPTLMPPNGVLPVTITTVLPLPCGCEHEISVTGELPMTMLDGRFLIDPTILHEFMQAAATNLTSAYGKILLTPGMVHEAEPSPMVPRDIVAPSTDTPQ